MILLMNILLQESGRLLPCGVDEWVHVNCALWSTEVYEKCSGILCSVHTAISQRIVSDMDIHGSHVY